MNVAANLLMEDSKVEIQEIALKMDTKIQENFHPHLKA